MSVVETVRVSTPSRSYDVLVGSGILAEVGRVTRESCAGTRCCVVSDSNVAPLYADRAMRSLRDVGYTVTLRTFEAGEKNKRLATLSGILEGLAADGLSRDDCVIALGGGVTGDMAGLAAALYLRGIRVVQVPTSLLAMVDSSVGGKTAVDLGAGKNLCGAFFQPNAVVADVDCVDTISRDLFTDSCGELIKHGVIADPELFDLLASDPINREGYDRASLARVIARNVRIKRDVVDADECERGVRQTLNFGHTLGHAVEAASDFSLGHGSSVACGMCCIARASHALGWCDASVPARIEAAVAAYGLPVDTDLDHDVIFEYATHDKKRHGETLNVVVPRAIGEVEVRNVDWGTLRKIISAGCGTYAR